MPKNRRHDLSFLIVFLVMLLSLAPPAAAGAEPECSVEALTQRFAAGGGIGIGTALADEGEFVEGLHLKVRSVAPGGPAETAGLRAGDGIYAVNGRRIERSEEGARYFGELHRDLAVGETVVYTVLRGDERVRIPVVAGPRPEPAVRYFVMTHLLFNRCPEYQEYFRSIRGKSLLQG
jgi:predicted metalloprotease with PDZ domain